MTSVPSRDGALGAPLRAPIRAPIRVRTRARAVAACITVPLAALSVSACGELAGPIRLERAAIVTPVGAPTTLFLSVLNTSGRPVRIAGVTVDGAATATISSTTAHRMDLPGAPATTMQLLSPVASVPVAAATTLRFAPGGYSVVLDGLARPLLPGDSARVTVRLESGERASTMARVVRYADLDTVLVPVVATATSGAATEPTVEEGRALYASDGCASCHGVTGHGDGPVARTLVPPPRDFREAAAFRNGIDESSIAQTIATGIPNGGSMPLFAHLSERERRSLARYVISLRTSPSPESVP
jgi:mono/diheme cytochrome c family protein